MFNNVNVLKFFLSKDATLDGLLRMAGRKPDHGPLTTRVLTAPAERQRFEGLLEAAHFVGPHFPNGDRLYQIAEQDGRFVAPAAALANDRTGLAVEAAVGHSLLDAGFYDYMDPVTDLKSLDNGGDGR